MILSVFIVFLISQIRASCSYTSFTKAQLDSNNFYQEKTYTRGTNYAFGVWTMYAPLRDNFYFDSSKDYYNQAGSQNGYHILNFKSDGKIQTLYYLQPIYFNMNNPYPIQQILQWTTTGVIYHNFQYHPYYYEGYWVFTYFSFSYQRKYNFASYNTGNNVWANFLVTNKVLQTQTKNAKLEYGGQGQYQISTYSYNLNVYPGRISVITIMDNPTFFSNTQQATFLTYIANCYIPSACPTPQSNVILDSVYNEGNLTLRQFNVDVSGLRFFIEFWVKRDINIDSVVMEHIFSYGAQFRSLAYYKQIMLYGKPALPNMAFVNKIQSFYVIPTDDYQSQISSTNVDMNIPSQDFSMWNYFRYDIYRQGTLEFIKMSIYQANGDGYYQFLIYANNYYFQYSNYQATVSIFTDITDISPSQMEPFKGDIANFRIKYCYSGDPEFNSANLNCHVRCKTCNGPTQWDCSSCYSEQNRFLRLNSCICLIDYIESENNLKCIQNILNIPLIKIEFNPVSNLCKFGYFQVWESEQFKGCLTCPYLNQHSYECIDCLMGSSSWQQNPICSQRYHSADGVFYEIQEVDVEYFSIEIEQMTVQLCTGCKSKDECLQNYFRQENFCKPCAVNCAICKNNSCVECYSGFYLKDNRCFQCSLECLACEIITDNIICTLCPQQSTLSNGQCLKCGQNCQECEMRKYNHKEYRKCIKCIYNTYISLDGESCYRNNIDYCRQPFQYSTHNIAISTISYDFQPQQNENIITGCIYCAFSYLNMDDNYKCVPMTASQIGGGCIFSIITETLELCLVGSQNKMATGTSFCESTIPNCSYCVLADLEFFVACYFCDDGYYNEYYTSLCLPCPSQCKYCYQSDSSKINKAIVFGVFITNKAFDIAQYRYASQNPKKEQVYIYCEQCQEGYTFYENQCILNCPSNCHECKVVNSKNICISCLQINTYSYFQLHNGECIPCPANCKLCKPRTEKEKSQLNPYFENEGFNFFSHSCVIPFDDKLFYDQDLKQFIDLQECEKYVNLEVNVYCESQQVSDPFHILFEQLFNSDQNNYMAQIETKDYFMYLNKQLVKYVNYKLILQQNSICTINGNSFLQTKFQQNVFNILGVNLVIEGNNSTLLFQGNISLSNFSSITLQNLIIQNGGLIISSLVANQIQMYNITISSKNLKGQNIFQLNNARSVHMEQINIQQLIFTQNSSIIYFTNTNKASLICNNFIVSNSQLAESNIINYYKGQLLITMSNIKIQNCDFIASQFIRVLTNSLLEVQQFQIILSTLTNCQGFFKAFDQVTFKEFRIYNSTFNQTILIFGQANFYQFNSEFSDIFLLNNSTLLTFSENFVPCQINLYNIVFRDIQYDTTKAILQIKQAANKSICLNMTKIFLFRAEIRNVLSNDYQQSSSQSLFDIEADQVILEEFEIRRGIGYSEFSLFNVQLLEFSTSTIILDEKFHFKSINANQDCIQSTSNQLYATFMYLQNVLDLNFKNLNFSQIIIFDSVLIDYVSTKNVNETVFQIEDCSFLQNILHQTNVRSRVSLFQIESAYQLDVIIKNNSYIQNLLYIGVIDNSHKQSLLFTIDASYTEIRECNFLSNMIINGSNSIMQIISNEMLIQDSIFINNSIFQLENLMNHLVWSFSSIVYLEDLQKIFPVYSYGGNGYFQVQNLSIRGVDIKNSFSRKGAGFVINMLENGHLSVSNSSFRQLNTDLSDISSGGCFYVQSYQSNLRISIVSSIFEAITTRQSGGVLHLQTLTEQTRIEFINSTFINVFALQGSLLYVDILQQSTIYMQMHNCIVQNDELQFEEFISKIDQITSNDLYILQEYSTLIYFFGGTIEISNLTIFRYPPIQLLYFKNSVTLTQIRIQNTFFTKSLISFNKDANPSKIRINDLVIQNCSLYTGKDFKLIQNKSQSKPIISSCLTFDSPQKIWSKGQEYDNSNYNSLINLFQEKDIVNGLLAFNNLQSNDILHMTNVNIQVTCSKCQQGVLGLMKLSDPAISIISLSIINSNCGLNGCVSITSSKLRLLTNNNLSSRSTIDFYNLLCLNNYAKQGGCLYISNQQITIRKSQMIHNQALFGGAIFIEGSGVILDAEDLQIINNTADYGSGLYSVQPFLQKQSGITFINNARNTLFQPPSMLHIQVFDNLTLIPTTIFKDKYHKVDKVLSTNSEEIIIYIPTGIKMSNYRRFDMKLNSYNSQRYRLQLIALTDQLDINNLNGTVCKCSVIDKNGEVKANLLSQTDFYFNSTTYILDDLIIYLPQNTEQQFWLSFWCESIYIPMIEEGQIVGYHQNYSLQIRIQPYECQLGEYHLGSQDYCHQCLIEMQQYSVQKNATFCSIKDDSKIKQITQAQIDLIEGYWRYHIWSPNINLCYNMIENCIGGWNFGNDLCLKGHIGALCEQCDYYNVQGHGQFTRGSLFKCQLCQSNYKNLITLLSSLIFFSLIINLLKNQEYSRQRGMKQLIFFRVNQWKLQEIPLTQCFKIILQYFQIITLVGEFKTHFNQAIQVIIESLGNPFQQLIIIDSCFLIQTNVNILYLDLAQNALCLAFVIILSILFYLFSLYFKSRKFSFTVVLNFAYFLYIFFGMSLIRALLKQLSIRVIQDEKWIYQNVAYIFNNNNHNMIALFCFLPILIFLCFLIPTFITFNLYKVKSKVLKQFGLWFAAYNHYQWEGIRLFVIIAIYLLIILIDSKTIMKFLFAYALLLLYMSGRLQKIIIQQQDKINVYYNQKLNNLEHYLNSLSISILILSSFDSVVTMQPFNQIIHYLIYMTMILSLLIIINFLFYFNLQKIRRIIRIVFTQMTRRYPTLLQYEFFYQHSEYSWKEYQRRMLLLKKFVQMIMIQHRKKQGSSTISRFQI